MLLVPVLRRLNWLVPVLRMLNFISPSVKDVKLWY